MKILCKENHWKIVKGQLILDTPEGKDTDTAKKMVKILEAQIRLKIYDEICAIPLTDNRKTITKAGIENVALTVQSLCAEVALGDKK
jgi:hypothetical protein